MVDQLTLQTIGILLTGISLTVAATYYTLTLRNTQRNRQFQILKQWADEFSSGDMYDVYFDLLEAQWTDIEDFHRKYGIESNQSFAKNRARFNMSVNIYGMMLKKGVFDRKTFYDAAGRGFIEIWIKYRDIIFNDRETNYGGDPSFLAGFEYLGEEMLKERELRGVTW